MNISKISVTNFKSFDEIEMPISNFNVLIGANASGKSNFVNIFEFLNQIFTYGIENAISLQGGRDFIRNVNIGFNKNLEIGVEIECKDDPIIIMLTRRIREDEGKVHFSRTYRYRYVVEKIKYDFSLNFLKTRKDFKIQKENLYAEGIIYSVPRGIQRFLKEDVNDESTQILGNGYLNINRTDTKAYPKFETDIKDIKLGFHNISSSMETYILFQKLDKRKLFLESEYMPSFVSSLRRFFRSISTYNIDPKLSKISARFTGKNELEPDGNNLVISLKNILSNKSQKENFSLLLRSVLPFIEDLSIERFSDKSLIASIKERYSKKRYFPASLMSDGTISILALIIILYFEEKTLIIIEEPERNLHPFLISKIVNMMDDVSSNKQIIITTHNPEIVKYSNLESLCLVKRDKLGFTNVNRVSDLEYLNKFLEEEIGIEDLFIDNILR